MDNIDKNPGAYMTIGEVAKKLDLINKNTGHLQTHTIRYWEKQFKQIKPHIRAGKRRYYSDKTFELLKNIKYLLKVKGLKITGVKKILNNSQSQLLDDSTILGIYKPDFKSANEIKEKIKKITNIIKELKKFK
jgi:DNA-binding transcriptional MerR regulator